MIKPIEAVYENGVLRPLESVDLRERERVTLVLQRLSTAPGEEDWLDVECMQQSAQEADDSISLESVREALSKIPGSLTADFVVEREDRWPR
jgi:predicted DNA-binding antitoxin AbrB/MazE fold protein